jgi:hypothetical protein
MSLPQFKELCVIEIEAKIREYTELLVETQQADHTTLRGWQGRIGGLMEAREVIREIYRKQYG